jgi:hypothetical protein
MRFITNQFYWILRNAFISPREKNGIEFPFFLNLFPLGEIWKSWPVFCPGQGLLLEKPVNLADRGLKIT